ncbi:MAG: hypothetical protein IJO29_07295 [Oscillospiraceae bacterium]|nr:hypothetical protein [Oscillospiraceae bacterium]
MDIFDILEFIFDILDIFTFGLLTNSGKKSTDRDFSAASGSVCVRNSIRNFLFVTVILSIILTVCLWKKCFWCGLLFLALSVFITYFVLSHSIDRYDDEFVISSAFGKTYTYKYTDIIFLAINDNRLKFKTNDDREYEFSRIFANIDRFYNIASQYVK